MDCAVVKKCVFTKTQDTIAPKKLKESLQSIEHPPTPFHLDAFIYATQRIEKRKQITNHKRMCPTSTIANHLPNVISPKSSFNVVLPYFSSSRSLSIWPLRCCHLTFFTFSCSCCVLTHFLSLCFCFVCFFATSSTDSAKMLPQFSAPFCPLSLSASQ